MAEMPVELKVPTVGESVTEVQIGAWLKNSGDYVEKDEPIVEIESDKATVEVSAPAAGTLTEIVKKSGEEAKPGDVIGYVEEGAKKPNSGEKKTKPAAAKDEADEKPPAKPQKTAAEKAPADEKEDRKPKPAEDEKKAPREGDGKGGAVMPAAARLMAEHGISADDVKPSGPGGRLLKEDVQRHLETEDVKPATKTKKAPTAESAQVLGDREEEAVPMTPMRKRIAHQLVTAQQTAALLTTFNEIDMTETMALRNKFKDQYEKSYEIKLGFMSFFVKACVEALKEFPQVNAEVRDTSIVYKNYFDIGIAVGGGKGLVVPVIRNADRLSFAEIEKTIADFGQRAQKNKIAIEELQGGTFTISNGGIYGSLLSTPIVNPPQSGILGMHAIQERPVVRNGEIAIRSMMYVALTYDHRIVDGREAVSFLMRVKQCVEDPARILLEV